MKKIYFLLISFILVLNLYAQYETMTDNDVESTVSGLIDENMRNAQGIIQGGKEITADGILRIPIVFVKFADDNASGTYWSDAANLPSWAATFVDAAVPSNGIYQNINLSKFYNLASGGNGNGTLGKFQLIGDIYYVKLNKDRQFYVNNGKDGRVSRDVLDILDDPNGEFKVDFRKYDNWEFMVNGYFYKHDYRPFNPTTGESADHTLDFMLIYWRDKSISLSSNTGGEAGLGFYGTTIVKDGINITSSNGVRGFGAKDRGPENVRWITAHEIGHHQFGGNQYTGHLDNHNDNLGHIAKFGLMTTGDGHQFSVYERYRLGWLDPIFVNSNTNNVVINDTHTSSTDNAVIIPVKYDANGFMKEYFILSNYHTTNDYSGANPFLTKSLFNYTFYRGIITYHILNEDYDWPTMSKIDMECADGRYDWEVTQGASTPSDRLDDVITEEVPDAANGFDERDNITATAGTIMYNDYLVKCSPFSGQKKNSILMKKIGGAMGKPKGKKQYSKEFKEKAVKLVLEGIKSQRRIAEEIGVNVNSLQKWKKEYLENQDPEKVRRKAEEVEIGRLRKELKEAKLELEILKKAVAYFSREQL